MRQPKPPVRWIERPDFNLKKFSNLYATQIDNLKLLSPREIQILGYIGLGYTTKELAQMPGCLVSVKTIETYKENIKRKLRLTDYSAMLKFAIQYFLFLEINQVDARIVTVVELVSRKQPGGV